MFYKFPTTESKLQLIWRNGLSITDLLAQVEGKSRLRNGTVILQVVRDRDASSERKLGVAQAQYTIKRLSFKPGLPHA